MTREEIAEKALRNAVTNDSIANYGPIIAGFMDKGINAEDITPRVNVFTFHAWRALGRTVRKGERGVRVGSWIECTKKDKETGEEAAVKRSIATTVFHISQTDQLPTN